MSAQDATFLHVENDVTPMHIGGVSIFEGPPPSFEELSEMVRGKLHHTPRYRQKVRFVPLGVSEPVWVDDPYFEVDYHLRHTAVPPPGSGDQLRTMAARVFSQHLDRARPLWEIWMVEGLEHGRWALLSKVHHCMVDGVAATDLMSVMFGDDAEPAPPADAWRPGPEPSDVELFVRGAYHRARHPAEQASAAVRARSELLRGSVRLMRAVAAAAPAMRPSASSLTGPIGPHRVWSWAHARLEDVKRVRKSLGGTVNDVVLAIVTNGFRDLLIERGEQVGPRRKVRTMVPVSVRRPGERGIYNNRVSAVFVRLPVGIDDPAERLAVIRAEMDEIKSSGQAVAGDVLAQLSGFAPPLLLALGSRAMTRSARLNMDTATTNVPGPQRPVHALGRRLLESYPYVPIAGTIRIVVAIFSYDGGLYFGVTGDRDHAADVDVLTSGIETGLQDLLARAAPVSA
jgi:WS/DGAT/MGAT family acyltransferase